MRKCDEKSLKFAEFDGNCVDFVNKNKVCVILHSAEILINSEESLEYLLIN